MILQSLIFAGLILVGDKHDRDHHDHEKYHPHYDHEWTERHRALENQEEIIREIRKKREDERERWDDKERKEEE